MARPGPLLGSDYLRSLPSTPAGVDDVSPSTCTNLSRFKDVLRQYRALDDGIIFRLNRAHALNRSRDPEHYAHYDNDECATIWTNLIGNWQGREKMIRFCVGAVSPPPEATSPSLDADDPYTRDVLRQQLQNELAVETVIRRRTMNEFLRRCTAYTPPEGTVPKEDLSHLPAQTRERMR